VRTSGGPWTRANVGLDNYCAFISLNPAYFHNTVGIVMLPLRKQI